MNNSCLQDLNTLKSYPGFDKHCFNCNYLDPNSDELYGCAEKGSCPGVSIDNREKFRIIENLKNNKVLVNGDIKI